MSPSDRIFTGESGISSEGIDETAVDWISRRDAGLNPADEGAFQAWLAADPRHAAAVDALQSAWSAVNRLRYAGRGDDLRRDVAQRAAQRQHRRYAVTVAGLAVAAVVAFAFFSRPALGPGDSGPTVALHPDRQLLSDGSTVELNFGAEIATDFAAERRAVRLLRGEALFQVAKDESRPFVVTAGPIAVRAVGTAFTVRFDPRQVDVLVTEGRVAVEQNPVPVSANLAAGQSNLMPIAAPAARVAPVFLSAGRRIVLPVDASIPRPLPQLVSSGEVAAALAWRNRRIEFNGTPLAEAVEIFNRDNAVQLSVANAATGELKISGVFWTNDPEAFSRVVETGLGLKAAQIDRGKIVLQR